MRVKKLLELKTPKAKTPPYRRGLPRQRYGREAERLVRMSAVAFTRWTSRPHGWALSRCAERLALPPATLKRWERRWREDRMKLHPRGRPLDRADRELRQAVIAMFSLAGPRLGLPTLQEIFPDVARSQLVELQRRYRFAFRRHNRVMLHALRWTRAGSVWAMDHSDAPCAIDGTYDKLLVVTDLASRQKLLSLPVTNADATTTRQALEALFRFHGAPLVLKSDNGSALIAQEVKTLLRARGVLSLVSPPGTPRYNGSLEAGIGSLKTRAHYESARHDRPGVWTSDDIEAARLGANETSRPEGAAGPTPGLAWNQRERITELERAALRDCYHRHEQLERRHRDLLPDAELSRRERSSIDRMAITRALIERDLLLVRRRRITPPFSSRLWYKIS